MQTPMLISDHSGVISAQSICSSIIAYISAVATLPCQSALCTSPVRRIACRLITPETSSFITSSASGSSMCGKRVSRHTSVAICVSLSATGSIALPTSLTSPQRRAMKPSATSVTPESSSTYAVP